MRRATFLVVCLLLTLARDVRADEVKPDAPMSVVRVNVTNQAWDFAHPWGKRPPYSRRAIGTILAGNRVLVTAELVANANYVELETAEGGQKEEGRDEDRARERNQGFRVASVRLEQDYENQRGLEKIVVECREELAPEQRGKPPRQQQGRWHAAPLLQSSPRTASGKNQAALRPPD